MLLEHDHTAETVRDGLIATVAELPAVLPRSLTWDQGAEMSGHVGFQVTTDMAAYFGDPGSPWQRGSNEHANGLLRQYFPKGTDLSRHTSAELRRIAEHLNRTPTQAARLGHSSRTTSCFTECELNQCCDDGWNSSRGMIHDIYYPEFVRRQPVEIAMHEVITNATPVGRFSRVGPGDPYVALFVVSTEISRLEHGISIPTVNST